MKCSIVHATFFCLLAFAGLRQSLVTPSPTLVNADKAAVTRDQSQEVLDDLTEFLGDSDRFAKREVAESSEEHSRTMAPSTVSSASGAAAAVPASRLSSNNIKKFLSSIPPSQGATPGCTTGCGKRFSNLQNRMSNSEIQQLRIEEIKMQILNKLRMKHRPNVTIPRFMLPVPLTKGEIAFRGSTHQANRDIDDFYGKTEQVIVIAENSDYPTCHTKHHDPAGCFIFRLADDMKDKQIASAELWTYKLRDKRDELNQTYIVAEISKESNNIERRSTTVAIRDTPLKNGWLKFDLTTTIRRWLLKSRTNVHGLEVSCKTCAMEVEESPVSNDPGERPFIVINFKTQDNAKRNKRSVDCDATTSYCCKDSLYVDFSDIGWNDWVIEPSGYMANYCRGSCVEDVAIPMSKSYHTTVIQVLLKQWVQHKRSSLSASQQAQLAPCCTPTKMSSISLLYMDDSGKIYNNVLPNMVVESCGCH